MAMSSETANRYFQGKENVAIAIARRRIKAGGDVKAALAIIPITKPLFARYREMIAADYPHLESSDGRCRAAGDLRRLARLTDGAMASRPSTQRKATGRNVVAAARARPRGAAGNVTSADGRRSGP